MGRPREPVCVRACVCVCVIVSAFHYAHTRARGASHIATRFSLLLFKMALCGAEINEISGELYHLIEWIGPHDMVKYRSFPLRYALSRLRTHHSRSYFLNQYQLALMPVIFKKMSYHPYPIPHPAIGLTANAQHRSSRFGTVGALPRLGAGWGPSRTVKIFFYGFLVFMERHPIYWYARIIPVPLFLYLPVNAWLILDTHSTGCTPQMDQGPPHESLPDLGRTYEPNTSVPPSLTDEFAHPQ